VASTTATSTMTQVSTTTSAILTTADQETTHPAPPTTAPAAITTGIAGTPPPGYGTPTGAPAGATQPPAPADLQAAIGKLRFVLLAAGSTTQDCADECSRRTGSGAASAKHYPCFGFSFGDRATGPDVCTMHTEPGDPGAAASLPGVTGGIFYLKKPAPPAPPPIPNYAAPVAGAKGLYKKGAGVYGKAAQLPAGSTAQDCADICSDASAANDYSCFAFSFDDKPDRQTDLCTMHTELGAAGTHAKLPATASWVFYKKKKVPPAPVCYAAPAPGTKCKAIQGAGIMPNGARVGGLAASECADRCSSEAKCAGYARNDASGMCTFCTQAGVAGYAKTGWTLHAKNRCP